MDMLHSYVFFVLFKEYRKIKLKSVEAQYILINYSLLYLFTHYHTYNYGKV